MSDKTIEEVKKKIESKKRLGHTKRFDRRKIEDAMDIRKCLACAIRQVLKEGKSEKYGILSSLCNSFLGAERLTLDEVETKEILKRLKELERA